jgi:hypothetical protein
VLCIAADISLKLGFDKEEDLSENIEKSPRGKTLRAS